MLALAVSGALALAAPGMAQATTLTFDDIPNANGTPFYSYGGFSWRNFGVLDAVEYETTNGPNGYSNGVVSSPNVALNSYGESAWFSSTSSFTLNDFYLTAAWMDGLNVQITGLAGGKAVDSATEVIDTSGPTHVVLNWTGVDEIEFAASGGVSHGYVDVGGNGGEEFGLDSVTVNGPIVSGTVPEPATWALLILGLGTAGAALRRHRGLAEAI